MTLISALSLLHTVLTQLFHLCMPNKNNSLGVCTMVCEFHDPRTPDVHIRRYFDSTHWMAKPVQQFISLGLLGYMRNKFQVNILKTEILMNFQSLPLNFVLNVHQFGKDPRILNIVGV